MFFRTQRTLLGIAIGDAFGAGYEFAYKTKKEYKENLVLDNYLDHSSAISHDNKAHNKGMYTDDTQMSIAVAKLLLKNNNPSKLDFASSFVDTYKENPIVGYSQGFQKLLDEVNSGEELLKKIRPNSTRNGAAMRSVPIGILDEIKDVISIAKINASTSHDTPDGIASSVAIAYLSYHRFRDKEVRYDQLFKIIEDIDPNSANFYDRSLQNSFMSQTFNYGKKGLSHIPVDAKTTVGAVIYLLNKYDDPNDILENAVLLGGDTDTVASLALGLKMAGSTVSHDLKPKHSPIEELPIFLLEDLINDEFGRDYLINLGYDLEVKYRLY